MVYSVRNRGIEAEIAELLGYGPFAVTGEGNYDPGVYDVISIAVTWHVENTGDVAGECNLHLIVQERQWGIEQPIVEADLDPVTDLVRIRDKFLTVPRDEADPRRRITYICDPLTIGPGEERLLTAILEIGVDLLEGKSELDIVTIVDQTFPEHKTGIAEHREANVLDVLTIGAFLPSAIGEPSVNIGAY